MGIFAHRAVDIGEIQSSIIGLDQAYGDWNINLQQKPSELPNLTMQSEA
jgi:hypothetical protein